MNHHRTSAFTLLVSYHPWLLPIERLALELAALDPFAREDEEACRSSGLGSRGLLECARAKLEQEGLLARVEATGWSVTSDGEECLALGRRAEVVHSYNLRCAPSKLAPGAARELDSPEALDWLSSVLRDGEEAPPRGTPIRAKLLARGA